MYFDVFRCYMKICRIIDIEPSFIGLKNFNEFYGRECRKHGI